MKKFSAFLALVLTLVMLMIPMSAMAEPTTATVVQIANPAFTMDGETRSMPGLALQLALCQSSDASLFQLIADVLVNNQNATSAMLQVDSAMNLVGMIGGMSSAYTVNLEEAASMATAEMESMMAQLEPMIASFETWTLPETIATIINNHVSTFAVTDMGVSANANGVEMQYVNISGDITNAIIDVMRAIETDSLILSLMEMANGYPVDSLGLVDGSGIGNGNGMRLSANIGTDANGSVLDIDADITIYSDNTDNGIVRIAADIDLTNPIQMAAALNVGLIDINSGENFGGLELTANILDNGFNLNGYVGADGEGFRFNSALTTSDGQDYFSLNVQEESTYTSNPMNFSVNYNNVKNGMSGAVTANISVTEYDETTSYDLTGNYAVTDNGLTLNGQLSMNDPYGSTVFTLNDLSFDMVNGSFNGSISYQDPYSDPMTFGLSLTPTTPANGAVYSGVLAFTGFDGYSNIGVSADINVLTTAVDTANFYLDPMAAINLMTMTEDQVYAAENELGTIMNDLGQLIMNTYPSLFE